MAKSVIGKFSDVAGSSVRRMYDASGNFLGTISKQEDGQYRVFRMRDSKIRVKRTLAEAFRTIRRAN